VISKYYITSLPVPASKENRHFTFALSAQTTDDSSVKKIKKHQNLPSFDGPKTGLCEVNYVIEPLKV
jgi:hypothetical protein